MIFVCLFFEYEYTKRERHQLNNPEPQKNGAVYTQLITLKVLQLGDCVFKTPASVSLIGFVDFPIFL